MTTETVYNTTDGPLPVDRAGRQLAGRERLEDVDVDAQPVKGHIAAGRFVIIARAAQDDAVERDVEAPAERRKGRSTPTTPTQEA